MIIILYLYFLIESFISYWSPQPIPFMHRTFGHLLVLFPGTSPITYCLSFLESILLNPLQIVLPQHWQTLTLLS